jgi:hypothetical protein
VVYLSRNRLPLLAAHDNFLWLKVIREMVTISRRCPMHDSEKA